MKNFLNSFFSSLKNTFPKTHLAIFGIVCLLMEFSVMPLLLASKNVLTPEQKTFIQQNIAKGKLELVKQYRADAEKNGCLPELERIIQGFRPWRTIQVKYLYEVSLDAGKTWKTLAREFSYDKSKRKGTFSTKEKTKDSFGYQDDFLDNGKLTSVGAVIFEKNKRRESRGEIKKVKQDWLPYYEKWLINYSWFSANMPFWEEGFSLPVAKIKKVVHNGKNAIVFYDFSGGIKSDGEVRTDLLYIFDSETGTFLEKTLIVEPKKGKNRNQSVKASEYVNSNGLFFPKKIEMQDSWCIRKYTITSVEINEPIPDEVFKPRIPYGCRIKDEINNTTYITPSLGNSGAEEEISKSLDELVKEAKKAK